MSINTELPQHYMAFKLNSGEILLIGKEDVKHIAQMIIIEGSLNKTCTVLRESDNNIEKANMLYEIIKAEKNMDAEIRNIYLKQIGELLSTKAPVLKNLEGKEVIINQ